MCGPKLDHSLLFQ